MPTLLLLKLTLAPLLVAGATGVAQIWGPRAGGLLMGLPLTTGPIFLFLTVEHGPHFGADATVGILYGLVGLVAFAVVYSAAAARTPWMASLAVATAAFFVVPLCARNLGNNIFIAGSTAWFAQALALSLMRKANQQIPSSPQRWWNIWARMLAVAVLTLAITTAAAKLGPALSGIFGTFPIAISVIVAFTHWQSGPQAVALMLRGCVVSWISFTNCFVVVGLTLEALGVAAALGLGVLVGVLTSVVILLSEVVWNMIPPHDLRF